MFIGTRQRTVNGKLTGSKTTYRVYRVDDELKEMLGSVRGKTFALLFMLFAAALFSEEHINHDLAQEKEIRQLIRYVAHLEKQTSTYYKEIQRLKAKNVCITR